LKFMIVSSTNLMMQDAMMMTKTISANNCLQTFLLRKFVSK
jgi:hypothetical protein